MTNKIKTYSLEELTDKHIGKRGTEKREMFEFELKLDILGDMTTQFKQHD